MNSELKEQLAVQSDEELLQIYTRQRNEYREEALQAIEQILTERNVSFEKIRYQPPAEPVKSPRTPVVVKRKVFIKVLLWMVLISILPMLSHMVYLEGKLFNDDPPWPFFHDVFGWLGTPLVWLDPGNPANPDYISFILYLINIASLSWVIAYVITWLRRT